MSSEFRGTRPPRAAVAVVSWNSSRVIGDCLDSLRDARHRGLVRVLVIDNDSSDGTADLVRTRYPWVDLMATGENLGYGRAANHAAAGIDCDWFLVANPDIVVRPGAIRELLAAGDRHPAAGILAPRILGRDGVEEPSFSGFPGLRRAVVGSLGIHRLSARSRAELGRGVTHDRGDELEVEWAVGALLCFRLASYRSFGGFDDGQWMYGEDLEVCWRARRKGWQVLHVPSAEVVHLGQESTSQVWSEQQRLTRKTIAGYEWLASRRGLPRALCTALVTLLGIAARLALRRVLAGRRGGADSRLTAWWRSNLDAFRRLMSLARERRGLRDGQ